MELKDGSRSYEKLTEDWNKKNYFKTFFLQANLRKADCCVRERYRVSESIFQSECKGE
jgi:hypothetical protein